MTEKNSIDTLKEQISFLEARIGRYEELVQGSTFQRLLFGGGRQAKISLIGIVISFAVAVYGAFKHTAGFLFVLLLAVLVLLYLGVQLNYIRKKNGLKKYQNMIASLTKEKASMEEELARLMANQE